jgi:Ribonuclease G/E
MVITADVSIQAQWRVRDWMDIIKIDFIGVERKGVDCLRLTQDKDE